MHDLYHRKKPNIDWPSGKIQSTNDVAPVERVYPAYNKKRIKKTD